MKVPNRARLLICFFIDHRYRVQNGVEVVKADFKKDLEVYCPQCRSYSKFLRGSTPFRDWQRRVTGEPPA
jgi:hypothetical protein